MYLKLCKIGIWHIRWVVQNISYYSVYDSLGAVDVVKRSRPDGSSSEFLDVTFNWFFITPLGLESAKPFACFGLMTGLEDTLGVGEDLPSMFISTR